VLLKPTIYRLSHSVLLSSTKSPHSSPYVCENANIFALCGRDVLLSICVYGLYIKITLVIPTILKNTKAIPGCGADRAPLKITQPHLHALRAQKAEYMQMHESERTCPVPHKSTCSLAGINILKEY
jgi:hypothetical protein